MALSNIWISLCLGVGRVARETLNQGRVIETMLSTQFITMKVLIFVIRFFVPMNTAVIVVHREHICAVLLGRMCSIETPVPKVKENKIRITVLEMF
jgi:hypothetical protein